MARNPLIIGIPAPMVGLYVPELIFVEWSGNFLRVFSSMKNTFLCLFSQESVLPGEWDDLLSILGQVKLLLEGQSHSPSPESPEDLLA